MIDKLKDIRFLILLIVLIGIGIFIYSNNDTSEEAEVFSNTESVREERIIPFGETGELSTLNIKINNFGKTDTLSSVFGETKSKENTIFILVDADFINTSKDTFTMYSDGIKLIDKNGVKFDTYLASSGGSIGIEKTGIDGRDLGNGIKENGILVYEVPKSFEPYALEIEKLNTNQNLIFEIVNPYKEVEYRIVEEEDISYLGCKRIGVRIIVPDESEKANVKYTLKLLAENYLTDWQDVTIWAWGYSELNEVGESGASKGIYEEKLSGVCN
jgi:hypothetical protein